MNVWYQVILPIHRLLLKKTNSSELRLLLDSEFISEEKEFFAYLCG